MNGAKNLNSTKRLLGGLLAAGILFAGASQAQATPVQWFLVDWEFEDASTASGSFVFDVDLSANDPNRWTNINIISQIGPTIFDFDGKDAVSDLLAFVTGDPDVEDLLGTPALLGELVTGMTNAGGTIDLVLMDNVNSSQATCTIMQCTQSNNPIFLVSGSITSVPEPSTALLVGSALGVLSWARRRTSP